MLARPPCSVSWSASRMVLTTSSAVAGPSEDFELGYGTDQVLTRMISSRFEKGAHVDQQFFKSSESILLTRCSPAEPSLYAPVAHRELGQIVTW